MTSLFRILSIDGGGIRGIIPAMVLAEIERRTGRQISEMFDMIAGTSTGGILALGLAKPGEDGKAQYTAAELVRLYDAEGGRIFSRTLLHQVLSAGNMLDKKYPCDPIEQVLGKYFGESWLSEAVTDILVTSYEIEKRRPFFFKSHNARRNPEDDFLMRDAARATSAAPTYFEPGLVANQIDRFALIDGGTYANNPTMCAIVEAICKFRKSPEKIFVVSLGTGQLTLPLRYRSVKDWGIIQWAQPILDVVFDGVSDTVDYQADLILNRKRSKIKRYYRLQIPLPHGRNGLDNTSPNNIRGLKRMAANLIAQQAGEISAICEALIDAAEQGDAKPGDAKAVKPKPRAVQKRANRRAAPSS